MTFITFGIPLLILFMALVMGAPFLYHMKLDRAYEAVKNQPDAIRLKTWYDR